MFVAMALLLVFAVGPQFKPWCQFMHWISQKYVTNNTLGAAMFGIVVGTWLAVGFETTWKTALVTTGICALFAWDDWRRKRDRQDRKE